MNGGHRNAVQLDAGADFGPASDTLTLTFFAWAEAAQLEPLAGTEWKASFKF